MEDGIKLCCVALLVLLSLLDWAQAQNPVFREESRKYDMPPRSAYKFGGPQIADLNGDGWDDLVLSNHAKTPMDVLYRRGPTAFEIVYTQGDRDRHGSAVHDLNDDGARDIVFSRGGGKGRSLSPPLIYEAVPGQDNYRQLGKSAFGFDEVLLRGRAPRFIDMDDDGDQDLLLTGSPPLGSSRSNMVIYRNNGDNKWEVFQNTRVEFAGCSTAILTTDIDDDGILDLVCSERSTLTVLKGTGNFPEPYRDVTRQWFGEFSDIGQRSYADYMTELDYDNDGRMDLYVSCGFNFSVRPCDDVLFRNTGSKFVDISRAAKIPTGGTHQEPAAGDFDLDGDVDLLIPSYGDAAGSTANLLLINQGDGTFRTVTNHGVNERPSLGWRGAGAGSLLMDESGLLHVIVGYERGPWRFYRNATPKNGRNFLALKVRDLEARGIEARGAKVTIRVGNGEMVRRVGSDGGDTQRLPDRVHFGLGSKSRVDSVTIRYVGGQTRTIRGIRAGFRTG